MWRIINAILSMANESFILYFIMVDSLIIRLKIYLQCQSMVINTNRINVLYEPITFFLYSKLSYYEPIYRGVQLLMHCTTIYIPDQYVND